jgi:hypothetical protein
MVCFYTDLREAQAYEPSAFLEFVSKNPKLQKASINMVCLNSAPTQHTDLMNDKYSDIATFWVVGKGTRAAMATYNVEEPNFCILVDAPGKIDYMGNLADTDFRTCFGALVDRGSSKSKYTFSNNVSLFQKYSRKFAKRSPIQE